MAERKALWFATAYTIVTLIHEASHALAASAMGLDATLFHFWATIDRRHVATMGQRAVFGAAGPCSSLVLGVAGAVACRFARRPALAVPLLFVAVCGLCNFSGNLMSAAFIGDFSNVAVALRWSMYVRYAVAVSGAIMMAGVLFAAGRALRRSMPPQWSRATAAGLGVALPIAAGMSLVILVNQPVALPGFAGARVVEAAVWGVAAIDAATAPPPPLGAQADRTLRWGDVATALVVFAVVRLLVPGVTLG